MDVFMGNFVLRSEKLKRNVYSPEASGLFLEYIESDAGIGSRS